MRPDSDKPDPIEAEANSSFDIRPSSLPQVDAQHPWLGLLPYKEEHREFFFGREREIEDILGRIRDNSLTILFGQSGWGKSSLLAAGVVPRLKEGGFAPKIVRLSFSERATLREQMLSILPRRPPFIPSPLDPEWSPRKATLWELFHRKDVSRTEFRTPVLILDQFEEMFTLGAQPRFEHEVAAWWEQISDLLQNRPPRALAERFANDPTLAAQYHFGEAPMRMVFTVREDYLAHLERWKAKLPLLMQNRMALSLLTGPQARQAVLGPAQMGEENLVSREVAESIVRQVYKGERKDVPDDIPLEQIKAVPPLLSLLCEQLNAARIDSGSERITAEMVREQSADILQRFYEDSFLSFPEEHRSRIRALLEDPPMITEGGFRNALVRNDAEAQLTRAGVPKPKAIFDTLIQRRLITSETRDQVQRLEITHDVLVPLLLRSRKERQDRAALEVVQRDIEARAEKQRQEKKRRRLRRTVVTMIALSVTATAAAVYGWWLTQVARDAERKAHTARQAAMVAVENNKRTLHEASMADYSVAVQSIERDGRWAEGVAHLARSLKWDPRNSLAAKRLYSTLALYAPEKQTWPRKILLHDGATNNAQLSPDGTRILTASSDKTARVWNFADGNLIGEPFRHEGRVTTAQFSPDGARIVTASSDKTARIWDTDNGKPVGDTLRHDGEVNTANFSPDGSRIVTASSDKTARIWDAASGKPIGDPLQHEGGVNTAIFNSDGSRIVTASWDKTARIWEAASGKPMGDPLRHDGEVNTAYFSPDGTRIVTASSDKTARIWEAASGKPMGDPLRHDGEVNTAYFSPDGTKIVTASSDKTARVWDATDGKPICGPLRHDASVLAVQFSPDGIRLVTGSSDMTARTWDAKRGILLGEPLSHDDEVLAVCFSSDGTTIVTASADRTTRVWDAATGQPLGEPLRHDGGVNIAQFGENGLRIVTASDDKTADIWDAISGKRIRDPLLHDTEVKSAQFSSDQTHIVTLSGGPHAPPAHEVSVLDGWPEFRGPGVALPGNSQSSAIEIGGKTWGSIESPRSAHVWEVSTGKPIATLLLDKNRMNTAQFTDEDDHNKSGRIRFTYTLIGDDGKPLGDLRQPAWAVNSAHLSPDGSRLVIAESYHIARVWDTATEKPVGESLHHDGPVNSAHFNPKGSRIVTASSDQTARVWDAQSRKPIGVPLGHEAAVNDAQFSSDGARIVTASTDQTARVWDAETGNPAGPPLRHEGAVKSAQFSSDGTKILTVGDDRPDNRSYTLTFDLASGRVLGRSLPEAETVPRKITNFLVNSDGTSVLTYTPSQEIHRVVRLWDAKTGDPIGEPLRHQEITADAQFSPDGKYVITASADKTARIWDAASGKAIGEPLRHDGSVNTARFSDDCARIVTASDDQTARIWEATMLHTTLVPVPEWMLDHALCIAGLSFDADGSKKSIPATQRLQLLVARPPGDDSWTKLARWLAMPASKRTLTPDSKATRREIAERERDSAFKEGIESALRYDPTVPLAHLLLARFEQNPKRAAFLRDYELTRLPPDSVLWSRASLALHDQEQTDAALSTARKALELNASLIAAHRALAYALASAGKRSEALQTWEKVLASEEATFVDFCDAGYLAAEMTQNEKTRLIFREGEKRFPTIPRLLRFKGKALLLLGAPSEALAALQAYEPSIAANVGIKPLNDAIAALAVSRWLTGDKDSAVADYQRLIGVDSDYANVAVMTMSDWEDVIKKPMLELLAETLKRHPELVPKNEKEDK